MVGDQLLRTLAPYVPHLRPHEASTPADWRRFLEAWRDPDPAYRCPKCGGGMRRRKGKRGVFLGCARHPECKGTGNAPSVPPRSLDCPLCDGLLVARVSKRGNRYEQCDTCGAFASGRYLTPLEKAQASADKKAKRAAKRAAKAAKAAKARGLQPEMVIQLDATNFDYREWFGEDWVDG